MCHQIGVINQVNTNKTNFVYRKTSTEQFNHLKCPRRDTLLINYMFVKQNDYTGKDNV